MQTLALASRVAPRRDVPPGLSLQWVVSTLRKIAVTFSGMAVVVSRSNFPKPASEQLPRLCSWVKLLSASVLE